ncbi:unnamed protein product [Closterium sp. NIES-53]
MYLMTCTRPDLAYPLSLLARYVAPGRHRKELRWLTYLLTDLGEAPRSPPVLYVDNKAMLALCQEHRLEHRMKHIALRYFLARELQQHGQLRLAYVASQANTADVFTKALQPCDHQRFCTVLGLSRPCLRRPSRPLHYSRPVAAVPYCRPYCGPALHPPLVSTRAALLRCAACCRAALPGTEPRRPFEPRHPAEPRCPTEPRRLAEPRRTAEPRYPSACTASAATTAIAATATTAATAATTAMASPTALTFDAEGRAVDFDVWVDDLQLFLQCDSRDGVSLFDHTSGVSTAHAATADSTVRS